MDRQALEAELDIVLDSLARSTILGAQQFTEKKRQFLMKVSDAFAADANARALLAEAAKALSTPSNAARCAQSDLGQRIQACLAGDATRLTQGPTP